MRQPSLIEEPPIARAKPSDSGMHQSLYEAIVQHRIPPGAKLAEEAVAEAFGVSRTRVRKVLQGLAHEQVVDIQPNRGAFVARPDPAEAREVFAARRVIEPAIIEAACHRTGANGLEQLRLILQAEAEAHAAGDRREQIRTSGLFHLELARLAGNRMLERFLGQLVARTSLIIAVYARSPHSACSDADHAELIAVVERGDRVTARRLMDQHLRAIEAALAFDRPVPEDRLDLAEALTGRTSSAGKGEACASA